MLEFLCDAKKGASLSRGPWGDGLAFPSGQLGQPRDMIVTRG